MTPHEPKPTAYHDPGRPGGPHPFGGAGVPGTSAHPADPRPTSYDLGGPPDPNDPEPSAAPGPGPLGANAPSSRDPNGAGPLGANGTGSFDAQGTGPLGVNGVGSLDPGGLGVLGAGGSGAANPLGASVPAAGYGGGAPTGTNGSGIPVGGGSGTHHSHRGEPPAAVPPGAQPAGAGSAARRARRALYKHAGLGPLRADGDPAAAAGGEDFFDLLARLAEPEDWSGPAGRADDTWVLREYVECAFERLYQQRQILTASNGAHSVFNTGLVTPQQEAIHGLFVPSRDPDGAPWRLQGWYPESERELRDRFAELPPAATYAEEPAELVYDWRRELAVSPRHLLESADNLAALPAPLNSNPYQAGLVLEGVLRRAEARVRRDHRAAVPCWDPAAERVRLLLPLSLTGPDEVDAALVVTRDDAQDAYRGHRLLGLDTAYARARQLGRLRGWLTP